MERVSRSKRFLGYAVAVIVGMLSVELAAQLMQLSDGTFATKAVIYDLTGAEADWLTGITLSSGRIPVLADINSGSDVTARNIARVEGCLAVDADASACDPVQMGGSASTAVPTAMSADGDMVRLWLSRNGAVHVLNTAGTATLANVSDTDTSTALISANTARLHAKCFNDSTVVLYINYGATASATAFTEKVEPGGSWLMEQPIYTGVVNGIWASNASGAARCTELTQ